MPKLIVVETQQNITLPTDITSHLHSIDLSELSTEDCNIATISAGDNFTLDQWTVNSDGYKALILNTLTATEHLNRTFTLMQGMRFTNRLIELMRSVVAHPSWFPYDYVVMFIAKVPESATNEPHEIFVMGEYMTTKVRTRPYHLNYNAAIYKLLDKVPMRRLTWANANAYVFLPVNCERVKLYKTLTDIVDYSPTIEDMQAEDWVILEVPVLS